MFDELSQLLGVWQQPILIMTGSLVLGIVLQGWLLVRLGNLTQKTAWKWDDIVFESLGRMPLTWCLMGGAYAVLVTEQKADDPVTAVYTKILITLFILTCTLVVARLSGNLVKDASQRSQGQSTSLFVNGAKIIVYGIGIVLILQNLEIEITPIITALGLGGLAVALALEETLNNLFCGVQIIASRLVRAGDYVQLESGHEGYVTDVKARNTTIRSFPDNNRIIVPNSKLASTILINFSLPERSLWIRVGVGVAYDSDLQHVEEVTMDVGRQILKSVEGGVPDNDPIFRYEEFGDSSINFSIRLYVSRFRDQFLITHEFIKALHKRYNQEGIEIPFPIRTVVMKNDSP